MACNPPVTFKMEGGKNFGKGHRIFGEIEKLLNHNMKTNYSSVL